MTAIYDCCYNLSALGDSEWNRRLVAAPALRNVRSARALPPFQKALLISAEQADLLARCRLVATTGCRRLAGSVSARRLRVRSPAPCPLAGSVQRLVAETRAMDTEPASGVDTEPALAGPVSTPSSLRRRAWHTFG